MKSKGMLLSLAVALLMALAIPTKAEFVRITLAGITPGETTNEEFMAYLMNNSCQYEHKGDVINVKPGCFHLPGNPNVSVSPGYEGKPGVIGQMTLTFPNERNNAFESYYEKLRDKYGKPSYDQSGLDQWVATWRLPDQSYILVANNNAHTGTLIMCNDATFRHELQLHYPDAYQVIDLDEI